MAYCTICKKKYWVDKTEMTTDLFCSEACEEENYRQIQAYRKDKKETENKRKLQEKKEQMKNKTLKEIYNRLIKIRNTSSNNSKIELLTEYLKDKTFLLVIKYMYNENLHYGIKKLPKFSTGKEFNKKELFSFLKKLANQKGTTDKDKIHLAKLASIDIETWEVVSMIVNKDAKCGFSGKIINKARPDTIFLMPYMRCSTEKAKKDKIKYPCIGQEKADGMFVNVLIEKGKIILKSRNGKIINQLEHITDYINKYRKGKFNNTVLHGELRVRKNGKILNRKTGNGILNSCLQNTAKKQDIKGVFLSLWDCIPLIDFYAHSSDVSCLKRLKRVNSFIKLMKNKKLINRIETKKINNRREAKQFYKRMRKEGKEGAILKNYDSIWKFHTSPNIIKMKNTSDCELRIMSWNYGKAGGENQHRMGALVCGSECGKLIVNVGGGYSGKERDKDWDLELGGIVTVEFESVIKSKKKELYSLYLPEFVEHRQDRLYAETLEQILEKEAIKKNS